MHIAPSDRPSPKRWPNAVPRAITLDLDDTLWPVGPTLIAAEAELMQWLAANAPGAAACLTQEFRAATRKALLAEHPSRAHDMSFMRREGIRRALVHVGEAPSLAEEAFEVFLAARQKVNCFEDVIPVLARWSQRYRLIALTNGNADVQRVGLGAYFHGSVDAASMGCAKPDPRIFVRACELAGVAAHEVLHVGDDPHLDVRGAVAAGLQAAWIRRASFAHRHEVDACGQEHPLPPFADLHALEAWLSTPGTEHLPGS
ncbi:MAG: Flavin mononucleotide phosphatase YigB [Pseudomonadota bacterium]|jgi:putative hydrolase of the HAD superfamily